MPYIMYIYKIYMYLKKTKMCIHILKCVLYKFYVLFFMIIIYIYIYIYILVYIIFIQRKKIEYEYLLYKKKSI